MGAKRDEESWKNNPKGDMKATRKQNDQLFDLVANHPRLIPVPSVHPLDGDAALAEMERVKAKGAKMLKIHQNTQGFDLADPAVANLVKKAAELDLPVLLEGTLTMDPKTVSKVLMLAMYNPKAKIVMAHMAGSDFRQLVMLSMLAKYPWWPNNVYYDLSATVSLLAGSPDREMFEWTVRALGVNRVMFGSDFPLEDPGNALAHFDQFDFSEEERRALLQGTAQELFGL